MTDSLMQLVTQLTQIFVPFAIIIGTVGNLLNIIILIRPALYKHACSQYFLALAGNNLSYSSIILIYSLFANGYSRDLAKISPISCKIIQYIATIVTFLSPYLIVLASIDRYCASSISARIRKFSNVRMARWVILIIITSFFLIFINTLVMTDIKDDGRGCLLQVNSVYSQIFVIVQVFMFAIMAPCLMALFGILTIYNSNQVRVIPVTVSNYYRTERQLARMLLLQVSIHMLLTLPFSIMYLIGTLPNPVRVTTLFYFLFTLFLILFHFSHTTPFFLYILSSQVYRKELIRLIYTKFHIRIGVETHPTTDQNIVLPLVSSVQTLIIAPRP